MYYSLFLCRAKSKFFLFVLVLVLTFFFLCFILLYQVTYTSSLLSQEMGSDPQEAKLPTCALYTLSVSRLPQNAADRATVPVTLLIYRTLYH